VTVTRLTLNQILAAGIDVTDPSNQNVYQFTAQIALDVTTTIPVTITFNGDGDALGSSAGGDSSGGGGGGGGGGCSAEFGCDIQVKDGSHLYVKSLPGPPDAKPFAYFLIPGTARFLKEFFDVHFNVVNTAAPEWVLSDTTATLITQDG